MAEKTLHDSWLQEIFVSNDYEEKIHVKTTVKINLLTASHKTVMHFIYSGVTALRGTLTPDKWPGKPIDLLVHEFSKESEGEYRHFLLFDRGAWLEVIFAQFAFHEEEVAPT